MTGYGFFFRTCTDTYCGVHNIYGATTCRCDYYGRVPTRTNTEYAVNRVSLSNAHKEIVAELYGAATRTVDDLPYTVDFDEMHAAFMSRSGREISKHDFWRALSSARKASKLKRKER